MPPRLIAFMAGAVVMRTAAYRQVGGYAPRFFIGAEELLMGLDLASIDWDIVYANDVVTRHHPAPSGHRERRAHLERRNRIWTAWMRLPLRDAVGLTGSQLRQAADDGALMACLLPALRGMGWALGHRVVAPPHVLAMWHCVFGPPQADSAARQSAGSAGTMRTSMRAVGRSPRGLGVSAIDRSIRPARPSIRR